MADDLATAARDLSVLPKADRLAILAALHPAERRRVEAAMSRYPAPAAAMSEPLHSPWFEGLPDAADVTLAARAAIAASRRGPAADGRSAGRSLVQAAGGLFSNTGSRR